LARRWFVNTAEDLCTEYLVEAAEVLCDPSALSIDTVVTFELATGGRATRLRLLAEEDDLDTIRAAMRSWRMTIREAVPRAKAALVQPAFQVPAKALAGSPPLATAREEASHLAHGLTTRDGQVVVAAVSPAASSSHLLATARRAASPPSRPQPLLKPPNAPCDQPKTAPAGVPTDGVMTPILAAEETSSGGGTAGSAFAEQVLNTSSGQPSGPGPGAIRARESWVWQIPTPGGLVGVNVGTPESPTPPVVIPSAIADFFAEHVAKPFEEHPRTAVWIEEVSNKDDRYHSATVAGQGQTDFDAPYKSLPAADKVLVYCYYYLQMHAASTLYVYDQAMYYCGLGLAPHTVFVDLGCGPLTLPLSLAWLQHLRLVQDEPSHRLRLHYIGIEQSCKMTERARHFLKHSGLFHDGPTFRFISSFLPADSLCREIDALQPSSDVVKSDIVLNMSYFIASSSVTVDGLSQALGAILRTNPSRRIWIVFQNPHPHSSSVKWQQLKECVPQFRRVSSGEENIGYTNSTNRKGPWRAKLFHEVLVRDPVGAPVPAVRHVVRQFSPPLTQSPPPRRRQPTLPPDDIPF
jgi:hypothetical protein